MELEMSQLLQAVLSLLFVLGLLVGLAWLARRGGLVARVTPSARALKTMQIVEILPLDARHKVIRLSADKMHYLILIGSETPLLLATHPAPEIPMTTLETSEC